MITNISISNYETEILLNLEQFEQDMYLRCWYNCTSFMKFSFALVMHLHNLKYYICTL